MSHHRDLCYNCCRNHLTIKEQMKCDLKHKLRIPRQVEPDTLRHWLGIGVVTITCVGDENTYAIDEFGHEVYAKLEG